MKKNKNAFEVNQKNANLRTEGGFGQYRAGSKSRWLFAFAAGLTLLLASCAHVNRVKPLPVVVTQEPVVLKLNPKPQYVDLTDYASRAVTKTFEKGEITQKITEETDFSVQTKLTNIDEKSKRMTFELTTIKKEGKADLSDFAMPELNNTLAFVLEPNGNVKKVEDISPGTIYYVPPVSLPDKPVRVGESWELKSDWVSAKSAVPLRLQVVSILKNIRDCGVAGQCAEIEISGDVSIIGQTASNISSRSAKKGAGNIRFRSDIKGMLLLSVTSGTVLYSIVKSSEQMIAEGQEVQIQSCMTSAIREPLEENVMKGTKVNCDPEIDLPASI